MGESGWHRCHHVRCYGSNKFFDGAGEAFYF